jgi:hypothetical protein
MVVALAADDYSPRYVGDQSKPLGHTFVDASGKAFDLTGVVAANMTFKMHNANSGVSKTGLGSWTIAAPDAPNGLAYYHWNAADVADADLWQIQAGVPFSDGMQHFQIKEIQFIVPL